MVCTVKIEYCRVNGVVADDVGMDCGSSHQTHYEQWGELWGTFVVEGQPSHQLHLRGYHDHSYG